MDGVIFSLTLKKSLHRTLNPILKIIFSDPLEKKKKFRLLKKKVTLLKKKSYDHLNKVYTDTFSQKKKKKKKNKKKETAEYGSSS